MENTIRNCMTGFAVLGIGLVVSGSALANPDFMTPRFNNTMVFVSPDGHINRLYFKSDGTLTGRYDDTPYVGTWEVKGDRLCVKIDPNRPGRPNPNCIPLFDRRVGQGWVNTGPDGKPGGVELLVEGIQLTAE
jgi:hypothetical protein